MTFQIDCQKEPTREILRVIRAEITAARRTVGSKTESVADRIHHARAACKRIRAALRLIRDSHPELYARENPWFRDSGRRLARLRDADVMLTCLGEFSSRPRFRASGASFPPVLLGPLNRRLKTERQARAGANRELARFAGQMQSAGRRLARRQAKPIELAAMLEGFRKTYRRARRSMPRRVGVRARQFHEWRKQTKFCGYQIRLLRGIRPEIMKALWHEFAELGEILGAEHDLSMLRSYLRETNGPGKSRRLVAEGVRQIERRRDQQRRAALVLGRPLFADKPRETTRRLKRWSRRAAEVVA